MPSSQVSRGPGFSRRHLLAGLGFSVLTSNCLSAVFKCKQAGGKVAYQSMPCPDGSGASLQISDASPVENDFPAAPPRTSGTEPELWGPDPLQRRAQEALALLKSRDPAAYAVVLGYIGRVEPGVRTAMRANADPPTMFLLQSADTLSVTTVAASFAHESYHSKMYFDYLGAHPGEPVPRQAWGGTQAEIKCERYALGVMNRIGASKHEIDLKR
jgi:hypothetical protein